MSAKTDDWHRLHPLTPLLNLFRGAYALVIVLLVAGPAAGIEDTTPIWILAGVAVGISLLAYLRFRYTSAADSLIITEGILVRRRRVIPRSRIQHIDLKANLVHQIFGVVEARIETAGGQESEASLSYISRGEGLRLRDELVTGAMAAPPERADGAEGPAGTGEREGADEAAQVGVEQRPAFRRRISLLDLIIAGATSNRAGLLFGVLLGGDVIFDFVPTDWLLGRILPPAYQETDAAVRALVETARGDFETFMVGVALLGALFALLGWGLSIILSVGRYFDFEVSTDSRELRVSYGLLTRRETGFRISRIQNVQIEESILRRWLGLAAMRVQTAGYGTGVKTEEKMEILTPIARAGELEGYVHAVFPDLDLGSVSWRRSHRLARRRMFFRRAAIIALATLAAWLLVGPYGLLLLLALIPAWILAALHYRHLGHAVEDDYVLTREGLWNRRTYIVPTRKIQALHLRQTPFQRRLGLGTMTLETAGSPYEWHAPRAVDVGRAHGLDLMGGLALAVRATGLTF